MSNLSYALIFTSSALLAVLLTPVSRRIAVRFDVMDLPASHKRHTVATPYLGGLALVVAVLGAVLLYVIIRPPASSLGELLAVMALAVTVAAIGFRDDFRPLGPLLRLGVEVAAVGGLWAVDVRIGVFGSDLLNFAATVIWVVGLVNAQNFLDNIDGLSAGLAAIASGWLLVIAAVNGQFLVAALAAGVMGCGVGFLWHNAHPAKIYMGDGGSLFLGFLLAYLTIKLRFRGPTVSTFLVPMLVVGVHIFDMALVVITRLIRGRSPLQGGTDHTSHRLLRLGLSVPSVVAVIAAVASGLGGVAALVTRVKIGPGYAIAGVVLLIAVILGILLGRVRVESDLVE
jgi:UDP-GlcNAc:undecaprenyl-phosphate GlcNAc-1-phosphate transferase